MTIDAQHAELRQIATDDIVRNPENPRLYFRQKELESLQDSIRQNGIQVPISVFRKGSVYVLIDGERRWRCSLKLNLPTMPALIQAEPSELQNLLLMFNIHSLREQWDLITQAMKLPKVIELMTGELSREPKEKEISNRTGLLISQIRRCKLLIDLPQTYKEELLSELMRPKNQQKVSEDFFIEMERALKTVSRVMPDALDDINAARDALIDKYRKGTIKDLTDLRLIPKIAKAEAVLADPGIAKASLKRLFKFNGYSAESAFGDSVAGAYTDRDLARKVGGLIDQLEGLAKEDVDENLIGELKRLRSVISDLLRRWQ
jgi:ParB family chromosome partitioning protein